MKDITNPNKNDKPQKNNSPKGTAAEWLIDTILKSKAVLFHDQYNEAYIAVNGDGCRIFRLDSKDFKNLLHHYYWAEAKRPLSRDADTQVISTLSAYACFEGPLYLLNVRVAKDDNGLWYDLGDGRAVQITTQGWQIVNNPPILFYRFPYQVRQATPEQEGELGLLSLYVNVPEDGEDYLLFLVNLVVGFIPGFPHPLLILYGPQGAGKSTPMRVMKELIDPTRHRALSLPSNDQEFAQIAAHHAFLFFDNISSLTTKMSDALARSSTGDAFDKRKLYSNDEHVVYDIQLPIALNGINQVVVKPDLLDRSILIELERIAPNQRISEKDFWEAFDDNKPQLLGAIFDVLVKALSIYPTIQLDEVPRMADFTHIGCAIAEAAGYTRQAFLDAYQHNIDRQNEEAIEASPVAKAVIALMKDYEKWESPPAELLFKLNHDYDKLSLSSSPLWPKSPEWMTRRLKEVEVNLANVGIHVDEAKSSDGRVLILTKDPDVPDFDSVEEATGDNDEELSTAEESEEPPKPKQTTMLGDDKDQDNASKTAVSANR